MAFLTNNRNRRLQDRYNYYDPGETAVNPPEEYYLRT